MCKNSGSRDLIKRPSIHRKNYVVGLHLYGRTNPGLTVMSDEDPYEKTHDIKIV